MKRKFTEKLFLHFSDKNFCSRMWVAEAGQRRRRPGLRSGLWDSPHLWKKGVGLRPWRALHMPFICDFMKLPPVSSDLLGQLTPGQSLKVCLNLDPNWFDILRWCKSNSSWAASSAALPSSKVWQLSRFPRQSPGHAFAWDSTEAC